VVPLGNTGNGEIERYKQAMSFNTGISNPSKTLLIGGCKSGHAGCNENPSTYNGMIDEVAIFQNALSSNTFRTQVSWRMETDLPKILKNFVNVFDSSVYTAWTVNSNLMSPDGWISFQFNDNMVLSQIRIYMKGGMCSDDIYDGAVGSKCDTYPSNPVSGIIQMKKNSNSVWNDVSTFNIIDSTEHCSSYKNAILCNNDARCKFNPWNLGSCDESNGICCRPVAQVGVNDGDCIEPVCTSVTLSENVAVGTYVRLVLNNIGDKKTVIISS
jgi:hypothetical protein